MPDLNLNEEGAMEEQTPSEPERKRPHHAASGQAARLIIIFVVLGVLMGVAYIVNELGIVNLWGSKKLVVARVEEPVQPVEQQPAQQMPAEQAPNQQPTQEPAKAEPNNEELKEPSKQEEPKPVASQQPIKQETKAAPSSLAKQELKQETAPQAPEYELAKPVAVTKKTEEPPKMMFKLKDPIVFSPKPRSQPTLANQMTAPALNEEPEAKPKGESRQQEPAPTLKMTVPQQSKAEVPEKGTSVQPEQQPAKQEAPAQPKQQATAPEKETPVQQSTTAPKAEPAIGGKGVYTVQVYAFREKLNAEAALKRLMDNGYPAFIEPIETKGMTWYTVRIGRYSSASEAKKAVESFAQEIKEHHFINRVRTKEN